MPFLTIAQNGTGLYKEKGSKFLAFSFRVKDEQQVKSLVESLRKEHPGACHVCYAFKLGYDGAQFRASDDGEPNNSAGQPILGQINAFGVTQVLIAVVRYYGGTKLGVGGLINAYRTAAKDAMEDSGVVEEEIMEGITIQCTYDQLPMLMKELKQRQIKIEGQSLDLTCEFAVLIKLEHLPSWIEFMDSKGIDYKTR